MSFSLPPNSNAGGVLPRAGRSCAQNAPWPEVPFQVGKYELLRELGRGGMGVVYEGLDTLLQRPVALKLLRPSQPTPDSLERLLREARWAARLHHPHAVAVYDAGPWDEGVYIAMELVRGASAGDVLQQQGRFSWQDATRIVAEVCEALTAAHAAELIHRDVKPANILLVATSSPAATFPGGSISASEALTPHPWAKLSDFGLSRSLHAATPATMEGQVVGTPHYMSPEQIRGEPLDERTDIYSLGATYFTLLTGRFPFERDEVIQVLFAHCSAPVPDPRRHVPDLPPACTQLIARCLAKEPRDRYRTPLELQQDLQALLAGDAEAAGLSQRLGLVTKPSRAPRSFGHFAHGRVMGVSALLGTLLACILLFSWFTASAPEPEPAGKLPTNPPQDGRVAPPMTGMNLAQAWSPERDGLISTAGEMEFLRLAPDRRTLAWGTSEGDDNTGRLTLFDIERQAVVGMHENRQKYASFSAVAFPNERYVLLAFSSQVVAIARDTQQVTPLIEVKDGSSRSLDVSADGRILAHGVVGWTGGGRVELYNLVWDPEGPRLENRRLANAEHQHAVRCVAISPDGRQVASADADGAVLLGDTVTGQTRFQWRVPEPPEDRSELGYCIQFSPDGVWLAAGGHPALVLWNVASGQQRLLPQKHSRGIMSIAFASDSRFVATGTTDGIRIWNVAEAWQAGNLLEGHDGNVITGMAWARKDRLLITAGFDRRIRFWNLGVLHRSSNEE
jgi:serine/threonine protein kinase